MAFRGKYTLVYGTLENEEFIHYVRICPLETEQYPHGLALATKCETEEEAKSFAMLVDAYIDEWLCSLDDNDEEAPCSERTVVESESQCEACNDEVY